MIVSFQIDDENLTPYEKNFLYEAPSKDPERKKNVKVVNVKPLSARRTDYTKGASEDDESDIVDDNETTDASEDDNEDYTAEIDDELNNNDSDDSSDEEDYTDDVDAGDDDSDNDNQESEDSDGNNDDSDSSESETDNEDYTDDVDAGDDDSDNDNSNDSENQNSDNSSDKDQKERYRKYNLFKDFINMRENISAYITRLDNTVSDSIECNRLYKDIINRFKNLNTLAYDYMIIKFNNATYFESFLFYQRMKAAIQFNIDLLGKIRKKEEKLFKSKNNKIKNKLI